MIGFFSVHFIANLTTNPNDDASNLFFDVYYVSVPLKLMILGKKKLELSYFNLNSVTGGKMQK